MKGKIPVIMAAVFLISGALMLAWAQSGAVSDEEISLRKGGVMGTTSAVAPMYSTADPGENKLLPRGFFGAPPMIPHSVDELATSVSTNDCVDCHGSPDEDTPGLPPSHLIKPNFTILNGGKNKQGMVTVLDGYTRVKNVVGNRFQCLLCHAQQAENADLLVDNTFIVVNPKDDQKKALESVLNKLNEKGEF